MRSESRLIKIHLAKYNPNIIQQTVLEYFGCSKSAIESNALTGELKHVRRILFYLLYMHTGLIVSKIRMLFNLPPNRMNEAINEARINIIDGHLRTLKDYINIINILKKYHEQ